MSKIYRIRGLDDDVGYTIGSSGVTRIEQGCYYPEPECTRIFYQAYKGDHLHSIINDAAVAEIIFKETPNE